MDAIWVAPILVVLIGTVIVVTVAMRVTDEVARLRASLVRLDDVRDPVDRLRADAEALRATLGSIRRR